ncbi:MAG TPA: hypothetical protein VLD19_02920 [Chitinophagaceae bacterium]|nr:hypothetical protein [Chitinophagaceae bacterium]
MLKKINIAKSGLLAALLLIIQFTASAQYETIIKTQAMEMAKALLAKDVEKVVQYMPPKLVEASGGKAKVLSVRDSLNKFMLQFGAEIQRVTIGNPTKIISYKDQLQSTLPQTTRIKFMESAVVIESTLIAISEDKGQHWYFVDTNIYRSGKLKEALPNLSPELVIPPMKKPEIIDPTTSKGN